ncbi:MAG: glycosyltransferase [Kofleriaceae bacterium]|nr:glycosyltransferase [Kofleriaceae bacterium]
MGAAVRVLFAIPALDQGGPDRVLFELIRGLDRSRFAPSLLVSEPRGWYLDRLPSDVDVHVIGASMASLDRYPVVRALRVVHAVKPAIVLSTLRMNLTMGMARPAFPRATRWILRQAADFSVDFARLQKQSVVKHRVARHLMVRAVNRADAIVCQSEAMRADLATLVDRPRKLAVIGNPIDVAAANGAVKNEIARWGEPSLVSVGRLLAAQKGFDLLIAAIAKVRVHYPEVRLRIIGEGPDRAALERQCQALGLANTVEFCGYQRDVLSTVSAADFFVLASRCEGFSNATLEALALGVPVVLTNCPGANREIVLPGVNGRLAAAIDAESVAAAVLQAIGERPHYNRDAIRTDTARRFGAAKIVLQYQSVFDQVIESSSR